MTPLFSSLLGACVGSFLNVCLYRWKSGGQIVSPSSHCPHCKKPIQWFDNFPILSFFLLKGRCRFCSKSISWQYPLVETVSAVLFYWSSWNFSEKTTLLLVSFFFMSFLLLLAVSDLKWRLLPHSFNNFFILIGLIFSANGSLFPIQNLFTAASGFVVMGSLLFGLNQFFPKGLGGGDIKMLAALAIWLGVSNSLFVLMIACLLASFSFLVLVMAKKVTWKWKIPFGAYLSLGALGIWFWPELIGFSRTLFARIIL